MGARGIKSLARGCGGIIPPLHGVKIRELRDSSEGTRSETNATAFSRREKERPCDRRADRRIATHGDETARHATREREGASARLAAALLHALQLVVSRPAIVWEREGVTPSQGGVGE